MFESVSCFSKGNEVKKTISGSQWVVIIVPCYKPKQGFFLKKNTCFLQPSKYIIWRNWGVKMIFYAWLHYFDVTSLLMFLCVLRGDTYDDTSTKLIKQELPKLHPPPPHHHTQAHTYVQPHPTYMHKLGFILYLFRYIKTKELKVIKLNSGASYPK